MPSIIDFHVTVSEPGGGSTDLNDHDHYSVVSWSRPGTTWRRESVTGRYVAGETLVSVVKDTATLQLVVRVRGSSWAQQASRAEALFALLSQRTYQVGETTEGVTTTWSRCQPADISPREAVDSTYRASAFQQKRGWAEYAITIRCDPQN